jgi:hypothetical protein
MMDPTDLKQPDPKRVGLEQDRIVLEYAINQLRSYLLNMHGTMQGFHAAAEAEKDHLVSAVHLYKAEQMRLLQDLIRIYEDDYSRLLKEDSL